jgi:hypothetical protein
MKTQRIKLSELKQIIKQVIEEGLPEGNSKLGKQYATTLNQIVGKINNPKLSKKAGYHASEIIRLIDEDQSM